MDKEFRAAYRQLNAAQKQAVDTIEGPVLVVAGPGTGKTQLLSMRVANIIRKTDTAPSNILCLTFTDNAARNMRERLETIIGQPAYHVAINTFHSFGSEVINHYPDYFASSALMQQVDELGRYEILREIFNDLPHSNPLSTKIGDEFIFIRDTLQVISWLKQNAIMPHELHELIDANKAFMESLSESLAATFADMPSPKHLQSYEKFLAEVSKKITGQRLHGFPEYAAELAYEFKQAIAATSEKGRFAPRITAWRNKWCMKNADGIHVFKDGGQALRKMHAVANVYQTLRERMAERGLYDYDDMIVEVVRAMESNDELRFNLQERYQYILVDEFQDTNKAQLRMLHALGSNPVHENRPNIMAVGDDDQAIYAFQGAEVSNMVAFARQYTQPAIITLIENYRSTPKILATSFSVADQLTDRLEAVIEGAHKQLVAKADHKQSMVQRSLFASELAQYDWLAAEIESLIKNGMAAEEIAVIAPRHKYLERLMPYLGERRIPVAYERRENILEAPMIIQLRTMAALVVAIADSRQSEIDVLLSRVLAYDFWELPAEDLLELNLECYKKSRHWLEAIPGAKNIGIAEIASWFVSLANQSSYEPLEYMIDQLLGLAAEGIDSEYEDLGIPVKAEANFKSPMSNYYFSNEHYENATDVYLTLLGQLTTLRHRLRQWKPEQALYIKDLVEFTELHHQARLKIIDTNPHTQTTNAVQIMTAYKAKGLEFGTVFVINAQDEVWGPTARSRSPSISLPRNLPIAPAGDSDNDRLRLLFVAMTRARHTLHITGYSYDLDNKLSPGLSFFGNSSTDIAHPVLLPKLIDKPATTEAVRILSTDWAYRFRQIIADKPTLLEPILSNYKLSVTHLNNFIDVESAGPQYFLLHNLLHLPEPVSINAAYGDCFHRTLQWAHAELRRSSRLPAVAKLQKCFTDLLSQKHLRPSDYKLLRERGTVAVKRYFKARAASISPTDIVERGFNNEGVVIGGARLSGKIDKLSFPTAGTVKVIDFKTGTPAATWQGKYEYEKIKLNKYRQQLLFYKLLVENSASYSRKLTVSSGELEFVEPDSNGQLINNLSLSFEADELTRFVKLIGAVWHHVMKLNFPDVSRYSKNLKGIQQFEADLIDDKI